MPRGKKRENKEPAPNYTDSWIISYEYTANGRNILPGTELSFQGESGRFRFVKHVINGEHEWVDVVDGKDGARWRSFGPESIKRVHYKKKTAVSRLKDRQEQKDAEKRANRSAQEQSEGS